jgi:hypothetical protein
MYITARAGHLGPEEADVEQGEHSRYLD